ncbi:uncharacterized protein LOC100370194 [Saccoglossus kowalevskii]|uniref:Malignant fibrous histiocytoma-amplified sequence 1 homolog n=1 Tax=Saccoglossus kowalevskii TaxID=10224 RepID=A0ABM0GK37_SACKO|nr:PREDICTED: malignant fibrous histiocytoma-amplified sequence 1 homolog [Saccoglossus kowalevskii]
MSRRHLRLRIDYDPFYKGKRMKLRGKELTEIPIGIFNLTELEILDMSPQRESCLNFRLMEVPREIRKLSNLRVLCLDTNDLTDIPTEVCFLRNLERLSISNNLLTSLPSEFTQLQKLKSLHMANNYFDTIPLEVCNLEGLEFLDASDNKIRSIPEEIGFLTQLVTLGLLYNFLERLPDGMCKCVRLRSLWLGKNKLQSLPRNFGRLRELDWTDYQNSSNLEGNPLKHPPIDIARKGPEEIANYFQLNDEIDSWQEDDEDEDQSGTSLPMTNGSF